MESSVDPPIFITVTPASNEQDDARVSDSMPSMTDNVRVITDEIFSTNVDPPRVNSPRPLAVLAAEATIAYIRSSRLEEAYRSRGEVFQSRVYSWADVLLDTPCQRVPNNALVRRSSSSHELLMYHHTRTLTEPALPHYRPKSPRPCLQSQSYYRVPRESSTQQQRHLSSSRILPPLEPTRRSRILITYNYIQNRLRILHFSMETRPNMVRLNRVLRQALIPLAILNQVRGLGAGFGVRQRGVVERAVQSDDIPVSVRRHHQLLRHVGRSRHSDRNRPGWWSPVASTSRSTYQSDYNSGTSVDEESPVIETQAPVSRPSPTPSDSLLNLANTNTAASSSSSTSLTTHASPPSSPRSTDNDWSNDGQQVYSPSL